MALLASFFLPSSSLINIYIIHIQCTYINVHVHVVRATQPLSCLAIGGSAGRASPGRAVFCYKSCYNDARWCNIVVDMHMCTVITLSHILLPYSLQQFGFQM